MAERVQFRNFFGIDAVIARPHEIPGGERRQSLGREPAYELRRDAVVALIDQRLEHVEAIAEAAHLTQVREVDAVLRRANELREAGTRVTLCRQLVEKRKANIL